MRPRSSPSVRRGSGVTSIGRRRSTRHSRRGVERRTEAWSRSAAGCIGSASFPAVSGVRRSDVIGFDDELVIHRVAADRRTDARILEAWLRHEARGDDRGRRSPCTRLRSTSGRPASPCATRGPAGGVPRDRAGCRSRGASSSRPPRPSRPSYATSWPISVSSGTVRGSGPWSRRAAPIIRSGAAGSTITRRSSTEPWRPTSSGVPARDRR